jgi:hypothetical protein
VCDGLDNNCDALLDPEGSSGCQTYYLDSDADNYGLTDSSKCLCSAWGLYTALVRNDCDDGNNEINPAANELCNSTDDNCNGSIDETPEAICPPGTTCQGGVCVDLPPALPFFSEYLEGSSNNKAVEIYNAGGLALDQATCQVLVYANGSATATTTMTLTAGSLLPGHVWVLCHSSIVAGAYCDQKSASLSFNGNDAVALRCGSTVYDVVGQIGMDPGTAWTGTNATTLNQTLTIKCSVTAGDTDGSDTYDPSAHFVQAGLDVFTGLGSYNCVQ